MKNKLINLFYLKDAHPKGEIFLGHSSDGFAIKTGVPPGARDQGFSFTLETPDRTYLLSAQSDDDRSQWMNVIQKVIDKPLTPQDATSEFEIEKNLKKIKLKILEKKKLRKI